MCVGLQIHHHLRALLLNLNGKIILAEAEIFLLSTLARLILEPTYPFVVWVLGSLSL
jgi:hypothetical protein